MGNLAKKSMQLIGLDTEVEAPKKTAQEKNFERQQADKMNEQEQEIRRRRGLLGQSGRRSLLSGGEKGV